VKVVLIPVKDPAHAKQRLARHLSSRQRQDLVWAMLKDVTRSVCSATAPDRVVVVTCSKPVARHALDNGWDVVEEEEQVSESESVDFSSKLLQGQGASALLRLPADIPLLQADDVDSLFNFKLDPGSAILVPSRDETGTNALLRTPVDAFPSRFGENSLLHHQEEARRRGIRFKVVENPRIALDLDQLDDLLYFKKLGSETRTAEFLTRVDCVENVTEDLFKTNAFK
jgi:2-phospho-L-lactate/phosphoenolpyruvate guanylyltransferase